MKKAVVWILSLALFVSLVACGGKGTSTSVSAVESRTEASSAAETPSNAGAAASTDKSKLRVATLMNGTINDGGFNTMAYEALKMAEKELGAEIAYTENVKLNDQVRLMTQYAEEGYNVIIGHGYEYKDALLQVGPLYPELAFLNFSSADTENGENVGSVSFAFGETGALMGVLVGMLPDVQKVGVIHAFQNPTGDTESRNVERFAKMYNPDIEFSYTYTQDWEDINKAKEAAMAQLNQGADVIVSDMSGPAAALLQAVEEKDALYVQLSFDAHDLSPERVVSSSNLDSLTATVEALRSIQDGGFHGQVYMFGIEDGVMTVGEYGPMVTEEMKAEVEKVQQEIIAGTAPLLTMDDVRNGVEP